jgi:hypothetical protein
MNNSVSIKQERLLPAGKKDDKGHWTWETKVSVAEALVDFGNIRQIAEQSGVGYDTLLSWKKSDWWDNLLSEVRKNRAAETSAKFNRLVGISLEKVQDRIENGDYVLNNKTGQIVRKPASLKDINSVLSTAVDKAIKLEQEANKETVSNISMKEMLTNLATEFAKLNRKQENKQAMDIPFVEQN